MSRHALLAVPGGNIARPIANVLTVGAVLHSQENRGMSVLVFANRARPENFHEIARLGVIETVKVSAEPQLVKQTRRAWAICVPAAPNAFAVALITNDQPLKRAAIETKLTARA